MHLCHVFIVFLNFYNTPCLIKSCQEAWAKIDSDHHKNKESLQSKFRMPPQLILRASNNLPAGRQILLSVFAGTS